MVCADDTLTNMDGWVDVSADMSDEENDKIPPLTEPEISTKEMNQDASSISLALRQRRQQEAQLAFLKEQGLAKEDTDLEKDNALEGSKDECEVKELSVTEKQDSTRDSDAAQEETTEEETNDVYSSFASGARKAGVAAAGGTLVAVGALLTPLPTPGGILLAGAGLGVLSTEFEGAKKVLDSGKEKLVNLIDSIPEEENSQEETEVEICNKESEDSEEDAVSVVSVKSTSSKTAATTISRSSSTVSQKGEVRASIEGQARRIGKSIRPFLTDEDAPRQAMEDLNASTKRACSKAAGKVNDFVSFMLVLDSEPWQAPPVTTTTAQQSSEVLATTTTSSSEAEQAVTVSETEGTEEQDPETRPCTEQDSAPTEIELAVNST